ncbi:PIR Superfamily Protein, partial [Plasmodium ovale curtisi]
MSTTSIYTLDKFAQQDREFKNATLYKVYNKLLNSCNIGHDEIYEGDDCSLEQYEGILNPFLKVFISKLVNNLKRIGNKEKMILLQVDNNEKQVCTYFKYWFLDYILYREFKDNDIDILFQKLDEKKEHFVESDCELFPMKLNDIMIMKKIYNYFAFYHAYSGEQEKIIEEISKSKYCENIKSGILYSDYYDSICTRSPYNNKSLCKEFNNYIKNHIKFEKNKLTSIKCVADQSPLIEDKQLEYKFSEDKQLPESQDTVVDSQTSEGPGLTGSSMSTVLSVSFVGTFFVLFL